MSSLTSTQRRLLKYASEDKEFAKLLRPKRAEDVAPVLRERERKRLRRFANEKDDTIEAGILSLRTELLEFVKQRCPSAPRKLRRAQIQIVNVLSRCDTTGEDDNTTQRWGSTEVTFSVKRLEVKDRQCAFSIVALAALQRRLLFDKDVKNGTLLLVLTEDEEDAKSMADYLRETYSPLRVLLLDGSRFPALSSASGAGGNTTDDCSYAFVENTVVFVSSLEAFLTSDGRSAIWKFVGAFVVLLKDLTDGTSVALRGMYRAEQQDFLRRLSEKRWHCLDHAPVAVVMAPSREALYAPLADALTTSLPAAVEDSEGTGALSEGQGNNSQVEGCAGHESRSLVNTSRAPVTVHYTVVEGQHRFHTLYALVMNARAGQGIVVHVATKEVCQFLHDVLHAIGELPPSLLLLTDYEGPSQHASIRDSDEDRRRLCAKFDATVANASRVSDSSGDKKDRVVLLSSFGIVPQRGSVFLQYDIIVDIANFSQFTSDILTPAAYTELAAEQSPLLGGRAAPRITATKRSRVVSPPKSTSPPRLPQPRAMYRHIVLLFRANEVNGALEQLNQAASRLHITYEPMKRPPPATKFLLSVQKLESLNRKQFAIQNAAYAAYRATMLLYSLISKSKEVYDERSVNLKLVAEEFGYIDAPIIDLRTRDTTFRPKENIFAAACKRAERDRRLLRCTTAETSAVDGAQT